MKKVILILSILLLSSCGKNIAVITDKDTKDIEVYSKIKLSDLISITDGYIVDDKEIEFTNIGSNIIEIEYVDVKKHKGIYSRDVNVIDTVEPILSISSSITKVVGKEYDLCEGVFMGDNYDRNLSCKVIGEYNKDTVGSYPLEVKVTDSSGNVTSKEITLNVVEKYKENNSNKTTGKRIEDVLNDYKDSIIGIDVSSYQGSVDWDKVKSSGVEFAMIRIGYGYNSNWELVLDKYFKDNLEGAKRVGLKVGVYFYTYANTLEEIDSQVEFIIENLEGTSLELGIAMDFENWSSFRKYHINFYDLNKMYERWKELCNKAGYNSLLYGSKYYLNNVWNTDNEDIWLAHYTKSTNYDKDYVMWQFSNEGVVPGIDGYVDLDILKQE